MKKQTITAILLSSSMMLTVIGCASITDDASNAVYSNDAVATSTSDETVQEATTDPLIAELFTTSNNNKLAEVILPDGEDFLTVRESPDKDNEPIGRLYNGNIIEVAEELDGWIKLKLDDANDAYVDVNYVSILNTSDSFSFRDLVKLATVSPDVNNTRLRIEPNSDSPIVAACNSGEQFVVLDILDGWVKVSFAEGEAYIDSDYVTISKDFHIIKSLHSFDAES